MTFIDTSVLVAWLCPEAMNDAAARAMSDAGVRLISPLVRVELASALSIKTRTGEMPLRSARMVLTELSKLIDQGVFVIRAIEPEHYRQASDWIATFSTPLRAADAVHLACSAAWGAVLLTTDRQLAASAAVLGVKHKLVR